MEASIHPLAALAMLAVLAGCTQDKGPRMPSDALDRAIGGAIGDPSTCVIIAERATHKSVYTYGESTNCTRSLPACDRQGLSSARAAVAFADTADGRGASCPTTADRSRSVGWAEGRVASTRGNWIYSAVMEGETALPGQEMAARLTQAFHNAGL